MDASFKIDPALLETIRDLGDRADNLVVPMTEIANLYAQEMRENITMRRTGADGSAWDALKATTLKRHDAVLGIESGETLQSVQVFVRNKITGAEATGKGGVFMHIGRGRDWRRGYSSAKPSKKSGRSRALAKKARDAFGERISGTEMDVREFGHAREETHDKATDILLDYLFAKVTE